MEKKSYPEILHNICVEFGHGEKNRVEQFEKAIIGLIDQIATDEKKKLLQIENSKKNEHYLKNDNIKVDCDSCSRHDIIVGCSLRRKNQCLINEKYTKYRRGHLLPCDRCKTYSVITKIDRLHNNDGSGTLRPAIMFTCLNCKDYPMINRGIFKGYELRGMEFTDKYLRMCQQKEQQIQKVEPIKVTQQAETTKVTQQAETTKVTQQAETIKVTQQAETIKVTQQAETMPQQTDTMPQQTETIKVTGDIEPEIEIIAISAE